MARLGKDSRLCRSKPRSYKDDTDAHARRTVSHCFNNSITHLFNNNNSDSTRLKQKLKYFLPVSLYLTVSQQCTTAKIVHNTIITKYDTNQKMAH